MRPVTQGLPAGAADTPAADPAACGDMPLRGSSGVPDRVAGPVPGTAAMTGSDVPATALGVTGPASRGRKPWASDVVPHPVYGLATASVHRALR
ncbi:hypothetical protein [Streptomyces thermoalcalitolerans]